MTTTRLSSFVELVRVLRRQSTWVYLNSALGDSVSDIITRLPIFNFITNDSSVPPKLAGKDIRELMTPLHCLLCLRNLATSTYTFR